MGCITTKILFPAPDPPSVHDFDFLQNDSTRKYFKIGRIPCLQYVCEESNQYMIYFHGNAEDLGHNLDFVSFIGERCQINIICVEFPGYGQYQDPGGSKYAVIEEDALSVYKYVQYQLKVDEERIIIFGRSMGSGPACYLTSNQKPKGLILMSAYSSLRSLARHHVTCCLSWLVPNQFRNAEHAQHFLCPILLIHGKADTLIPYSNSEEILNNFQSAQLVRKYQVHFPVHMDHNRFDIESDIVQQIIEFLEQIDKPVQINQQ